jgi:hypothetical protein
MEKWDEELVARLLPRSEELRQYIEEHQRYEEQLEKFSQRPYLTTEEEYLTTEEEMEKKRIQKLKLAGRDKIEAILAKHR